VSEIPTKVDVVILTKNSIEPCLRQCLLSAKKNIPINRFIVIDGGSTDKTIEVVKEIFPEAYVIYDKKGNRATSRQKAIEIVETKWFVFLDSDVILNDNWMKHAVSLIRDDVGAVQGRIGPRAITEADEFEKAMSKLRKFYKSKHFTKPDATEIITAGDVLIRTDLVKDINIPNYLHIYEDRYIKNWILKKNYAWIHATKEPSCIHCPPEREPNPKTSYLAGFIAKKAGYINLKRSIIAMITILPKIVFALIFYPNIKMAIYQFKYQAYFSLGVFRTALLRVPIDSETFKHLHFSSA